MDEKEKEMIQRIKEDLMKITAAPRQLETPNPLLPEDDRNIRVENDVGAEGVACDVCNALFSSTAAMENHKRNHPHQEKEIMIERKKEDLMKTASSSLDTAAPRQLETPNPLLPEYDRNIRVENDVGAQSNNNVSSYGAKMVTHNKCTLFQKEEKTTIQLKRKNLMRIVDRLVKRSKRQMKASKPPSSEDKKTTENENDTGEEGVASKVCNSLFSSTVAVENHKRKHQGRNHKYQCRRCPYSTNKSSNFQNHYHTHTGEKNHKCHICPKAFIHKSNLKIHLRAHSGVKPYRCPICGRDFSQSPNLKTHIRRKHSQQRTNDSPTEE